MSHNFVAERQQLIISLRNAGIYDQKVLVAISNVPRELFVDETVRNFAYLDHALPIGMGQTISQPLMVAMMTQALQLSGRERVLEIGTGSGYQTAILSQLAAYVYSVERYQVLACQAAQRLLQLGRENVSLFPGDGSAGWPAEAPYDRILVTAAAPAIPPVLITQLEMEGLLIIPVGKLRRQRLLVVRRISTGMQVHSLGRCVFVPLVGEGGWHE